MTARLAVAVLLLFSMVEACASEDALVRGEVSWTDGVAKISECETGRVLRFGAMASSPYFRFTRRYDELAGDRKNPVLVEVEGAITRSSSSADELTIEHPRVINLAMGTCGKARSDGTFESGGAAQRQR